MASRLAASAAAAVLCGAVMLLASIDTQAQGDGAAGQGRGAARPGMRGQPPPPGSLTPREVQAEFERYAIDQAQDALQLSDDQYQAFVRHVGELHRVRRQTRAQRTQLLGQLTRMLRMRPSVEDGRIAAATKAIDDHERHTVTEIQRAYAAVDEALTPRQRARFRVLEDQLEHKKLDMLFRARQGPRR